MEEHTLEDLHVQADGQLDILKKWDGVARSGPIWR